MIGATDEQQAIAYLLLEIRDLRVHLERAEEHIAVITNELVDRERRISEFEAALREIRDHEHMDEDCPDYCALPPADDTVRRGYGIGCIAGHRCAAEIARKALEEK